MSSSRPWPLVGDSLSRLQGSAGGRVVSSRLLTLPRSRLVAVARLPQRRTLAGRASPGLQAAAALWRLPDPDSVGSEMGAMSGPTVACNWLVPGRVLIGAFPAAPGDDGAHEEHLGLLLDGTQDSETDRRRETEREKRDRRELMVFLLI